MRNFTPKALAFLMALISTAAYSADSGFFVGAEVNRGGNLIYGDRIFEPQTHQVRMREGENITGKVGYDLALGSAISVRGAIGYAFSKDNSFSTETNHVPVELMLFARNGNHRFGAGAVAHLQRNLNSQFKWTYNQAAVPATATTAAIPESETEYNSTTKGTDKAALGFKLEYNYDLDSGLFFGAHYTYMRYEYDNKLYLWDEVGNSAQLGYVGFVADPYTGKTNASSAGISIGYRF